MNMKDIIILLALSIEFFDAPGVNVLTFFSDFIKLL